MERKLISAAAWKAMVRRRAKPADFDNVSVFKAGAYGLTLKTDPANPDLRAVEFVLSNANLDREGDSIAVEGWSIENYLKNPVVLWAHDHGGLPIARSEKTWRDGPNLKSIDDFSESARIDGFANTVHQMIVARLLNAVSVGFQPSEWDPSDTGMKFLRQDLLEHSVCPVPAHPEALVVARSKGINVAPLKDWAESILDVQDDGLAAPVRRQAEALYRATRGLTGRRTLPPIGSEAGEPIDGDPDNAIGDAMALLSSYVLNLAPEQRAAALDEIQASLDALVADVQAAADLAPAGGGQRARRRRTARQDHLIVDGDPLPDADDFERAFASLTKADIHRVIEEEIGEQLMKATGRVWP